MGSEKPPVDLKKKIAINAAAAFFVAASGIGGASCATPDVVSKNISSSPPVATQPNLPEKFNAPPAQRQLEISTQTSPTLPSIKEYNDPKFFIPRISFRLTEKPPVQKKVTAFAPDGKTVEKQTTEYFFPFATLYGYLIAKETTKDGSLMLAVEVPQGNKLFSQADLDKSLISIDNKDSHEQVDKSGDVGNISNVIVWLKLQNSKASGYPFGFSAQWAEDFSKMGYSSSHKTSSTQEVYGYSRIGDPIFASCNTAMTTDANQQLTKSFQTAKGNVLYEQAVKEYSEMVSQNGDAVRLMIQNSGKKSPTLKENLQNKTYILNVNQVNFIPQSK